MHRLKFCVALFMAGGIIGDLHGQTPGEIGHQGILTDSLGNPYVEGAFELTFSLYDQAEGGSAIWSELQTVNVEEGLFTVLLGSENPIDLPFDEPYWLEIQVDGDALDPRLRFTASPYARRAASVDSVGVEALRLRSIPADRINTGATAQGAVLAAITADSAGWTLIGAGNIANNAIPPTKFSVAGGGSGQVLTIQGTNAIWADPPEITGAAIPDKSVRSTKLNSEDGELGLALVAAGSDSAVWSVIGPEGLADRSVTAGKLSELGSEPGQILVAQGDSVAWTNASALPEGSIPGSKIENPGLPQGQVLMVVEGDTAGWGLVGNESIQDTSIESGKISAAGGATGQILTVDGADAVWSDPAGIGKGTIVFDRISTEGGSLGDVLVVTGGDTVNWAKVGAANVSNGSVTPAKLNTGGAAEGNVLVVDAGGAAWSPFDGTFIADGTVPVAKFDEGPATAGSVIAYNGTAVQWAPDGLKLPFKASVTASDSVGIRVSSPSVLEGSGFAIQGVMTSSNGGAFASALRGENRSTSALGIGVWGSHEGGGWGVYGRSTSGRGIYGSSPDGFAGYFSGNVRVTGSIEKAGGSFKIDHPLDPENRYLLHSFVESPDMMNVYNGNVTLDGAGEATVTLPDWFEALNADYRYQLTAIGAPGPNLYVAQEIAGNQFRIAGGEPGLRVSWQVTGIRNDAWARQNRIPVEEIKEGAERGTYLHPEAFGVSPSRGVDAADQQPER